MTDRNTISQVIESLFEDWIDKNINVHPLAVENMRILEADALELLKEQEAVEPYQHDAVWLCGNCEKEVVGWDDDIDGKENRYPFCRQCGKPVKWNENT